MRRLPWWLLLLAACDSGTQGGPPQFQRFNPGQAPAELAQGERLFNTYCTSCHGYYAKGEGLGPSLLDTLYRADRLPDQAIIDAVQNGVPQTHWHYGAMPRIERVGAAGAAQIVPYVRWLQGRAADDPNVRKFGS